MVRCWVSVCVCVVLCFCLYVCVLVSLLGLFGVMGGVVSVFVCACAFSCFGCVCAFVLFCAVVFLLWCVLGCAFVRFLCCLN